MGWISKVGAPEDAPHPCTLPGSRELTAFKPGSIWQCDVCRQVWRFEGLDYSGLQGSAQNDGPRDVWRRVSPLPPPGPSGSGRSR